MILVYTGDGKGKTSACVGQAMRALGQGMRVAFYQYLKRNDAGGEQRILQQLLQDDFIAGGVGFLTKPEQFPRHREVALRLTEKALVKAAVCEMLILDEALYALTAGILTEEELRRIMGVCEECGVHLVLSGRGMPEWVREVAHLVTEMSVVKHPYMQNVPATRGIEF